LRFQSLTEHAPGQLDCRFPPPLRAWLALVVVLLACAPPLFIRVGQRVSTHTMENVALVTSQETWLRWHEGDRRAWLVTSNDALPRVEKPPLLTWLNFLAWADLSPQSATPAQLTFRARIVTGILGLIMIVAIFWTGHTLGGVRIAVTAGLVAGSMFFMQRQARTASYDIHFVAWATLAVASGLWAMNSGAADTVALRRRRVIGWIVSGLATACSVMSKNPLSFLIILMPLIAALVVNKERWRSNLLGLALAMGIAAAPVAAWYGYALTTVPGAMNVFRREFEQPRTNPQVFYYYLGAFGLLVPWTLWLICGLVYPWADRNWGKHRLLLVPWFWFVLLFLFFSVPPAKQQRYILPIVAPAALLCAHVLFHYQRLVAWGRADRLAFHLGNVISIVAIGASACVGPALSWPERLQPHFGPLLAGFNPEQFSPLGALAAIATSLLLLTIASGALVLNLRSKPLASAWALAAWTLALTTLYWSIDLGEPRRTNEVQRFKVEAERVAAIVGGAPIGSLRQNINEGYRLNEEFRFYFGRLIRRVDVKRLDEFAQTNTTVFILTRPREQLESRLQQAGFVLVDSDIMTDNQDVQQLWIHSSNDE
jgi:4-amino-4-deoxy-L-arabinose transferase-like glycosyltransferase